MCRIAAAAVFILVMTVGLGVANATPTHGHAGNPFAYPHDAATAWFTPDSPFALSNWDSFPYAGGAFHLSSGHFPFCQGGYHPIPDADDMRFGSHYLFPLDALHGFRISMGAPGRISPWIMDLIADSMGHRGYFAGMFWWGGFLKGHTANHPFAWVGPWNPERAWRHRPHGGSELPLPTALLLLAPGLAGVAAIKGKYIG
jgi:hypothetical protein